VPLSSGFNEGKNLFTQRREPKKGAVPFVAAKPLKKSLIGRIVGGSKKKGGKRSHAKSVFGLPRLLSGLLKSGESEYEEKEKEL